jgi:hypothetical protein
MASQEGTDQPPALQIEILLEKLQEQTSSLGDIWHAGEADQLRNLAGQLAALARAPSGAQIREYAMELESLLMAEEAEASAICERIEYLILQCKKAASTQ